MSNKSLGRLAFEKANRKSGLEAILLYLQSISHSLLDLTEKEDKGVMPSKEEQP